VLICDVLDCAGIVEGNTALHYSLEMDDLQVSSSSPACVLVDRDVLICDVIICGVSVLLAALLHGRMCRMLQDAGA
jgi:hypothetical protein